MITAYNIGLLLWGQTEGNPTITPLFSFGYGVDRLLIGFTFKIKIRFFNWVLQPGRTQQQSPTAASPERWASCQSHHFIMNHILTEFEIIEEGKRKIYKGIVLLTSIFLVSLWIFLLTYYNNIGFSNIDFADFTTYLLPLLTILIIACTYILSKNKLVGWYLLSFFEAIFLGLFLKSIFSIASGAKPMIPLWRFGILTVMAITTISIIILLFHKKLIKGMGLTKVHLILSGVFSIITFLVSYCFIY